MSEIYNEVVFRGSPKDVIWRSEVTVLKNDVKIFSRKDCDIIFLRKGAFLGAFDDREEFYLVDNEKQGFLSKLFHGKKVSDDCEIFYINKLAQLENKWGTPNRIDVYDKKYDMHTSVGAYGSYKFSINNSMKLFSRVQGSAGSLSQDMVREFFRSELNTEIRNAIATIFHKKNYGLKDIATITMHEKEIAKNIKEILQSSFNEYGVTLNRFFIGSFMYDEEFLNQIKDLKKDIILKDMKYQSEKDQRKEAKDTFKTVTDAAVKFNKSEPKKDVHIHNDSSNNKNNNNNSTVFCNQCGQKNPVGSNFCSKCGSRFT